MLRQLHAGVAYVSVLAMPGSPKRVLCASTIVWWREHVLIASVSITASRHRRFVRVILLVGCVMANVLMAQLIPKESVATTVAWAELEAIHTGI
jgi:hypothetical protein